MGNLHGRRWWVQAASLSASRSLQARPAQPIHRMLVVQLTQSMCQCWCCHVHLPPALMHRPCRARVYSPDGLHQLMAGVQEVRCITRVVHCSGERAERERGSNKRLARCFYRVVCAMRCDCTYCQAALAHILLAFTPEMGEPTYAKLVYLRWPDLTVRTGAGGGQERCNWGAAGCPDRAAAECNGAVISPAIHRCLLCCRTPRNTLYRPMQPTSPTAHAGRPMQHQSRTARCSRQAVPPPP
jgi:hypothetical protein